MKKRKLITFSLLSFTLLYSKNIIAETNKYTFKPLATMEMWGAGSNTFNKEKINGSIHFRRLRFGAKGKLISDIKYTFQFNYDRLGQNPHIPVKGESKKYADIWNAYITKNILKEDLLNIHAGYYHAPISREYHTSYKYVSSIDKTSSVPYLRKFSTSKGNGIIPGVGFGGIKVKKHFGLEYRSGIFLPQKHLSKKYNNPLFTGRLMLSFGNRLKEKYKYMLPGNDWERKKNISIGFGGSFQNKTDNELPGKDSVYFTNNISYGADFLLNFNNLRIDGEYYLMQRSNPGKKYYGREWHLRFSYNYNLKKGHILQPSMMSCRYNSLLNGSIFYSGNDILHDAGINWYINSRKTKLGLHYIIQRGSLSESEANYLAAELQIII